MGSIVIKYTPYTIISDYASYSLSCFTGATMYFVQAATVTLNTKSRKEMWTVLPHFFIQKFYSSIFEAFTNAVTKEVFYELALAQPTYQDEYFKIGHNLKLQHYF